jgi:phosphatidylglycerol lysyltransferase
MTTDSATRLTDRAAHTTRDVERARALALLHGWNAMAYQVVNDGISHWFSADGSAVVGYVRTHRRCIVAGAPICAGDHLPRVLAEWEAFVESLGCRACYFGAAGRVFDALHGHAGYATVVLGAQPVWNPAYWPDIPASSPSLRGQMHRATNKGVQVSEWSAARASADERLHDCLAQWLRTRKLPTMHFLVEPNTLHDLQGRRIFVAERGDRIVGFINASPIPARSGWLVEQFVRSHRAPNGTIELLLDCTMRALAESGATYVTMGLVPLRQHADDESAATNPAWLTALLAFVRLHGRRFYNFEGLERFKSKFRPHGWEPIYAISAESTFSVRTLYAIAAAFTVQSPVAAAAGGLTRAILTEARRLRAGLTGSGKRVNTLP